MDNWIKIEDRMPELTEPLTGFDDDNQPCILIENFSATVLGYNETLGVYKARRNSRGWSEISSSSINCTDCAIPTHWQPLPEPPKPSQP